MWQVIIQAAFELIGKVIPDPQAKAEAQRKLLEMEQSRELEAEKQRYSAIVAEAGSQDPWTSRARPSFMYVFYALLIFLVIILPIIGLAEPTAMTAVLGNIKLGFAAIPEEMWWTFTAGYLGYTTARSYEKKNIGSNGITKG